MNIYAYEGVCEAVGFEARTESIGRGLWYWWQCVLYGRGQLTVNSSYYNHLHLLDNVDFNI